VAHVALADRFDRYRITAGYNGVINQRQFRAPSLQWPTEYRYPDETYTDRLALEIGASSSSCSTTAARPTTLTWGGSPRVASCSPGDMFIWASPNCGHPQKVQRYARDWARRSARWTLSLPSFCSRATACRSSAASAFIRALTEGAELLESLVEQTLA
jgi:hypothetical protein